MDRARRAIDDPARRNASVLSGPARAVLLTVAETQAVALYFDAAARALDVAGVAPTDVDAAWTKLVAAGLIGAAR
jgi:hypothetical protein